jgi:hypothetical protein
MLLQWCAAKSGLKVCETEVAWRRQRMLHGRKSGGSGRQTENTSQKQFKKSTGNLRQI